MKDNIVQHMPYDRDDLEKNLLRTQCRSGIFLPGGGCKCKSFGSDRVDNSIMPIMSTIIPSKVTYNAEIAKLRYCKEEKKISIIDILPESKTRDKIQIAEIQ
ncbi:MAG: hypothetical protein WB392_09620 [Methanotrichaceae archaeon]